MAAQIRGADIEQAMEGEHDIETSSREQAVFWRNTYREILAMEESVMGRVWSSWPPNLQSRDVRSSFRMCP